MEQRRKRICGLRRWPLVHLGRSAKGITARARQDKGSTAWAVGGMPAPCSLSAMGCWARAAAEMAALAADFPDYQAALLAGMVEDHCGDVAEVRAGLRVRTHGASKSSCEDLMSTCSCSLLTDMPVERSAGPRRSVRAHTLCIDPSYEDLMSTCSCPLSGLHACA